VYKSSIGQKNIQLADGTYTPYVWDEQNKILKFADSSIHLNGNEWEFWSNNEKVHEIAFYPETKKGEEWQKEVAHAFNFRIKETKTTNAADCIEIAYDLETSNQKSTIALRAGGSNDAQFSFDTEAKQAGEYRLAIEQDSAGLEPIYANVNTKKIHNPQSLPVRQAGIIHHPLLLGYRNPETGFYWKWLEDETAHYIEEKQLTRLALLLNEDKYQAGEIKGVYPDTWGPTGIASTNDDAFEIGTASMDLDGIDADGINAGYVGANDSPALRWQNVTVPSGSTISDTRILVDTTYSYADPTWTSAIYGIKEANPADWSSGTRPSQRTKTTANVSYKPTAAAWIASDLEIGGNLSALTQEIIDGTAFISGNAMAFAWVVSGVSQQTYRCFEDYDTGGFAAQLTITYTPAAGAAEAVIQNASINNASILNK
ncbi:MAG: hypothetical protein ABIG31_04980, partial [Candidatus Omnitrophota bacterium]